MRKNILDLELGHRFPVHLMLTGGSLQLELIFHQSVVRFLSFIEENV